MTSTNFNVGMSSDRASSKVLKPPGGGTSDIFGGSEPTPTEKSIPRKKSALASSIVLDDNGGANAKPVENGHSKADAAPPAKPSQPISNGHAAAAAAAPRARVPPGGFSSGLW